MRGEAAGVDDGDDDGRGTRRHVPCRRQVDAAHLAGWTHVVPLARVQRIVRHAASAASAGPAPRTRWSDRSRESERARPPGRSAAPGTGGRGRRRRTRRAGGPRAGRPAMARRLRFPAPRGSLRADAAVIAPSRYLTIIRATGGCFEAAARAPAGSGGFPPGSRNVRVQDLRQQSRAIDGGARGVERERRRQLQDVSAPARVADDRERRSQRSLRARRDRHSPALPLHRRAHRHAT